MQHCDPGNKPKVSYKFNGKNERYYQSNQSPIDVEIGEEDKPDDGESKCYKVTFTDATNRRAAGEFLESNGTQTSFWIRAKVATSEVRLEVDPSFYAGMYAYVLIADGVTLSFPPRYISAASIPIVLNTGNPNCPPAPAPLKKNCTIKIFHEGALIFKDQGDCPCIYEVACNGRCKPGEIECPKPDYPGYCCIPCEGTANKINNLANKIR